MQEFVPGSMGKGVGTRGTAAVGRAGTAARAHMTREEKHAATLKGVSDVAYSPWTGEIGAGFAALAGMGIAKTGAHRVSAVMRSLKAPFRMLTQVRLNNLGAVRAETIQSVADVSQFAGGRAHEWVGGLNTASATALAQDTALMGRVGGFFAPLRNWIGSLFESRALSWLEGPLEKMRGFMEKRSLKKSDQAVEGIISTIGTRGEKASAGVASVLSTAEGMAHSAQGLSGQARIDALHSASAHVASAVRGSEFVGKDAKALFAVSSAFKQAAHSSTAALAHESAAGSGVRGLMSNLAKMGGRATLMQAMIGVGVAFGVGAIFATRKAENVATATALKDMSADIGDPSNAYMQGVQKFNDKMKGRRLLAAGASSVGEAANMAFMSSPIGGAGMGMGSMGGVMAMQMGLPMLGNVLVPENTVLNSYVNLQKAERGDIQIPPAEKIAMVRQLVGAVPMVQPHGGYYNKLAEPIAAKIIEQKLSLRDTMQLLANNEKFTALAAEVKAAQDAKPQHPAPDHKDQAHAKVEHAVTPETVTDAEDRDLNNQKPEIAFRHAEAHDRAEREHAAGKPGHAGHTLHTEAAPTAKADSPKPSLKISASEAEHDGTVDALDKAVAQG